MTAGRIGRMMAIGLAMLALMTMHIVPAGAYELEFSQTTGFNSTTGTLQGLGQGNPAVIGQGGLEYTGSVTTPPGPPIGDGTAPPNIFQIVGWGCQPGVISAGTCANGGTIGSTTSPATNPFTNVNRSSLQVLGQFGSLVDFEWRDITLINHHNNPISGNVLNAVDIDSILRLGPFGFPNPDTVTINFTETINTATVAGCTASAGSGAPVNPLGSRCDDFVRVGSVDLSSIFLPAGTLALDQPDLFIDFRLDPRLGALVCTGLPGQPAACGAYSGTAIIIYTDETATHGLAIQGRIRFPTIDVPEPASLLLLGGGLLGAAALAARRRRHA
jgi:hypothetical protein